MVEKRKKVSQIFGITVLIIILASIGLYFFESGSFYQAVFSPPGVDYENHSIQKTYSEGEIIRGSVRLSFEDVGSDSVFSSNMEGNLTLKELLEANNFAEGDDYNCSTPGCEPDYLPQDEVEGLSVGSEGSFAGFRIIGDNVFPVHEVNLSISSNAGPSCTQQLLVDVLNDGEFLVSNNANSGQVCSVTYRGCFDEGASMQSVIINQNDQYCEKLTLPSAPGFELRAKVENSTSGRTDLKMALYNDNFDSLGECILGNHTQQIQDLGCVVNSPVSSQGDYYVCIKSGSQGSNYKIKFETSSPTCGSKNLGTLNTDYEISAKSLEFGSVNGLKIQGYFSDVYEMNIADYVQNYISDVYDGNCNPGCSIPIKFFGKNQQVSFSQKKISYDSEQGRSESNKIYSLKKESSEVNSGFIDIDLSKAEFKIPLDNTASKFKLYIDEELVFEERINVSDSFDFNVEPKFVAFGQNARFRIISSLNISRSEWEFGDGSRITSQGREAEHRYLEEGEFEMKVKAFMDSGDASTRFFDISVGDAKEFANVTLSDYRSRIVRVEKDINLLPEWISGKVREKIDIVSLNSSIKAIQSRYDTASSDEEYQQVMLDLVDLKIPESINFSERGDNAPLLLGFDNIDPNYIESLSGKSVENTESLKNNIAGWMNENTDAKISFEKLSAFYDEPEVILSKFKIETKPVKNIDTSYYLIIGNDVLSEGAFMGSYNPKVLEGSGTYIFLDAGSESRVFEFLLEGEFNPEDLGAYLSPNVEILGDLEGVGPCNSNNKCEEGIGENKDNCPDCQKTRWGWFVLWMAVLLFGALVVYIILQEWYKKYYEKSLFHNRDDLYNLLNFVYNARKSGLGDGEIKKKLKNAGWKGEKIGYAFRKIDGKRTGLYEIPVLKFMENTKVRQEIAKRQGGRVDARFIKRPNL